ncbi:DNA translocase FtsK [Aquibacillus sediminis]|uniref:DNA translocase FtsK n=1 Tax=Aquibacillus sediminis TaxID=2574734 RepID=UPI0011096D50|nr:DNA translocase FtsK [Aquibacillus sediminis]
MWKQLKNKFIKWFESEPPNDVKQQTQLRHYTIEEQQSIKNIETKMSYKYPSDDKVFQLTESAIPNIPNRTKRTTKQNVIPQEEEIGLKPRSREEHVTKQKTRNVNEADSTKSVQIKNHQQIDEKFTPTDVPSPIYGFQQRPKGEEQELQIPAYIRKDKVGTKDTEQGSESEQEQTMSSPLHETVEPIKQQEQSPNRQEQWLLRDEVQTQGESMEEAEEKQEVLQQDSDIQEQQSTIQQQSNDQETSTVDGESENVQQQPKTNVKPFNVIMTPRDKKQALQQRAQTRSKTIAKKNQPVPLHLLNDRTETMQDDTGWIEEQTDLLETTLRHFHIKASVVDAVSGPAVTRFEIQPEPGVKVSKIKNLSDDIKLNLAAKDIRIEAPIPGKNTIGIEVPNRVSQPVMLQQLFESEGFRANPSPLTVALGLDIAGSPIMTNLNKMPHGLIAGATGSGKSVCINTILVSLLYKANHEDVRFLLIDPKMVELAPYNDLPHLVSPVITDVKAATKALKWAVEEMEERYQKFVHEGARDIERYNQKMIQQDREHEKMPYLVIVIDELADLMMVSPHDVEDAICRIAQKARAAGIHLLLATQRPSVDVITGLIKSNIPTRIAFSVASQVDSRTMIDTSGAEKLLGKGDMLFVENGARQAVRIQGAFVSDEEIERITGHIKKLHPTNYLFEQEQLLQQIDTEEEKDELYQEAVEFVMHENKASTSLLQRRFKIGYNRAARLIDQMVQAGIISEQNGSKPRDVLVTEKDVEDLLT